MHINSQAHLLYQLTYLPQPISLAAMNGAVVGTGVAVSSTRSSASIGITLDVHNVLLMLSCRRNLFSGLQLAAAGLVMLGDSAGGGWRLVHDATGQVVAKYQRKDNNNHLPSGYPSPSLYPSKHSHVPPIAPLHRHPDRMA